MEPPEPASRRPATSGVWRWQAPTAAHLQEMLPQYEVLEILGQGGMGAVYKARQKSLRRLVAIKVLPLDAVDDELRFVHRFRNEAYTLAQLSHPGIVSVYDFGETTEGQLYFVMEFVDGTDLAQLLYANGRMPLRDALRIAIHVCDALTYAHAQGVIHRDIKPANVLIDRAGVVKVADFGLAKAHHASQSQSLTRSQTAVGTPDYVAPEVLCPGMTADHRADLYAVGVMLYQMVTGEVPRGMFKLPSQKVPGLDTRLDEIVCRAMEQDLSDRFQTAAAVRQAFDDILTSPLAKQETAKDEPHAVAPKSRRFHPILTASVVALLATGAGTLVLKQKESPPQQMPAFAGSTSPGKKPQTTDTGNPAVDAASAGPAFAGIIRHPFQIPTWQDITETIRAKARNMPDLEIQNGTIRRNPGGKSVRVLLPGETNYAVRVRYTNQIQVDLRTRQSGGFLFVACQTNQMLCSRYSPGTTEAEVLSKELHPPGFDPGVPHDLIVIMQGHSFRCWLDGRPAGEATDEVFNEGPPGLMFVGQSVVHSVEFAELPTPPVTWQDVSDEIRARAGAVAGLVVEADLIRRNAPQQPPQIVLTPAGRTDYWVSATYSQSIQINPRSSLPGRLYVFAYKNGVLVNREMQNRPPDKLAQFKLPGDYDTKAKHELTLSMLGSRLRIWLDDHFVGEVSEGILPYGQAGLTFLTESKVYAVYLGDPPSMSGQSSDEPQKLFQTAGRIVNLLPLVDLARDAFRGIWSRSTRGISVADPAGVTVLELPYRPPKEYDFEMEFTPDGDGMNVNQYISAGGRPVAWKLNSHHLNPPLYGFDLLDGKFAKEFAEAATRLTEGIEKGRRYKSKLEIRRGSIRALLDDKEILHWAGDFNRFSIEDHSRMSDDLHIGIGSWRRAVTFHKIQVTEMSGAGQIDASAPEKAAWRDWLTPRLQQGQFTGNGWITETGGLATDQALRGEAVLPAATRDGAVRLSYTLRNSEGGSVTFRSQGDGEGRAFYTGYDTGKTLFLSRNLNGKQLRLASESIPPEISATPERTLEVRFMGNRMTATLNGAFTISAIDDTLTQGECAMVLPKGALLKKVETLALETPPPWQWLSTKPEDFGKNLKQVDPQCVMFRDKILFLTQKTVLAKQDSCQGAIRAIMRYFEGRTGSVTVRASEDVLWGQESFATSAWISSGGANVTLSVHHPNQIGSEPDKHVFRLNEPVRTSDLFSIELRVENKQIIVIVNGQQAGAVEDPVAGTKRLFGVMPPLTDFGEFREIAWQRLPDSP